MTVPTTIETSIGPADVLHRLAVAVECIDPLTQRLVLTPVVVGRELVGTPYRPVPDPAWPCVTLMAAGPARHKVDYERPLPTTFVLRVDDPWRHYVPRRLKVKPWKPELLDHVDAPAQSYVPVDHRLVRVWLSPGSAAPLPVGTTVVRGRVVLAGGAPARWARVTATGPGATTAGTAHADDRGEFVLVVTDAQQAPLESSIPIDIDVVAPKTPVDVDPDDRLADLVVEDLPDFPAPPNPAVLDSPLLRGTAMPPGYVASTGPSVPVVVPTGTQTFLSTDVVFTPPP